jgi:tetratricopeptide (TPR) repeat protein
VRAARVTCAVVLLVAALVSRLAASGEGPRAGHARAYHAAYELDFDAARNLFEQALAVDAADGAAHRGLATVAWLEIAFARGTITVEELLGNAKRIVDLEPPPPALAGAFTAHIGRAMEAAERAVRARPRDPDAHYQLGAVEGLRAAYTATIEGRVLAAFRPAKRAFDAHERVLALAPRHTDAALVPGVYRYLVSTLPAPGRWLAYVVGFGGGREQGLAMVEAAAGATGEAQTEARLALVLFYNRDRRFDEALGMLARLRARHPRNRLLWLETGATALRAGRLPQAEAMLVDGMTRLAADRRPRAFGEEALWHYTLGAVRLARRDLAGAKRSLGAALAGPARAWVHGRTHLALARAADLEGDRPRARREYERALTLARTGRDPLCARAARAGLRAPFR